MEPHLQAIRALDPDAVVGFKGSLARGFKGPHKKSVPFDSSDFDVDAFIVSDTLLLLIREPSRSEMAPGTVSWSWFRRR